MKKYVLEKSKDREGWWVFTDTEFGAVIQFEERKYNETQHVTFLAESKLQEGDEMNIARVLCKMGEWIVRHHASLCFTYRYAYEWSEDNARCFMIRKIIPRLRLEILDECDGGTLRAAMVHLRKSVDKNATYAHGGTEYLTREIFPRLSLEILDECDGRTLSAALVHFRKSAHRNFIYANGKR